MKEYSFLISLLVVFITLSACSNDIPRLSPLTQESTILSFGDSLTYGTGTSVDQSYPSILSQLTGINIINDGVPGEITASGRLRLKKSLKKYQPNLVILCHGGNDLIQKLDPEQTKKNLENMINMIHETGSEVVLLAVPRPGLLLRPAPYYKELADKYGLPLEEDVLAEVLADRTQKSDPAHPNDLGYKKIALEISALLIEAKAIKQR